MTGGKLDSWPLKGGLLERFGLSPSQIEERSLARARELVEGHFSGTEANLVAAMVYAAGDPDLVTHVRLGGDPVGRALVALEAGRPVLVDVTMLSTGVRLPVGQSMGVALRAPGAERLARTSGTTRAAAGMKRLWDDFGRDGLIAVGNAPTALLATLDLAAAVGPPACVIATCPGFTGAAEAKEALMASGLPYLAVIGSRGGSGVAVAALNFLLSSCRTSPAL
ncbi:MAG: precorrin-8X methylmutase [Candidatus Dormibacteria bacterium]